jgi:nucleoside-diphosphate-sugar epimerase
MKVLVTGHAGYIGSVLAPMLAARGHVVIGCDTNLFSRCTFGRDPIEFPNIGCDSRDIVIDDLRKFDGIVHLAGLSNDPLGDLDPDLTIAINAEASLRIAQLAKRAGVERFVFSSSCSSYGAAGDAFLDESAELNPVTPYGRSKVLAEEWISPLASDTFTPVFLRNATVYGPSPRLRFDLVVNNLTAWAFAEGSVFLKSDGRAWRPLIHVEDVARAFIAALEAPADHVRNERFNVGATEENYRVRQVAEIVAEELPSAEIRFSPTADADARNYRVDCTKFAQRFPEFKPRKTVRDGVRELIEAYQRYGLSSEDFEGSRYQRIGHLRMLQARGLVDAEMRPRRPKSSVSSVLVR